MRTWKLGWPAALAAGVLAGIAGSASGIDVEFTYQGYLEVNGIAIDGLSPTEIVFTLLSDPVNGNQVGTPIVKAAGDITLDDGVFSTPLAFEVDAFDGRQLWLEIEIDGTALSPRQKVNAAPYSLATRGLTVDDRGYVGVFLEPGEVPINPLTVGGPLRSIGPGAGITFTNPSNTLSSFNLNWFNDTPRLRLGGSGAGANSGFDIQRVGDQSIFRILDNGDVGLREPNPDLRFTIEERGNGIEYPAADTLALWTNGAERMRLHPDGDVTIGASSNGPAKLNIVTPGFDDRDLISFDEDVDGNPTFKISGDFAGTGENNELQLDSFLQDSIITVDAGGNVAINAGDPRTMLDVNANDRPLPANARGAAEFLYTTGLPFPGATPNTDQHTVDIRRTNGLNGAAALNVEADAARAARFSSDNDVDPTVEILNLQSNTALELISFASNGPMMEMTVAGPSISSTNFLVMRDSGGNRARINGSGRGFFNGGTQTGGADVAEWFAVEGDRSTYEPGDLLIISTDSDRTVTRSTEAYCTLVTGVYATRPGVLLTERHVDADHSDMVPMGVIGVVPTKVSAENGPIRRGDLLVSSTIPGHAMKGTDRSRMLGAIVGKALEGFDGTGTGVIRVMVSPK
ncbi:MAG: hypothetical protein AAGI53_17290 [Planctomycetota bacterium]